MCGCTSNVKVTGLSKPKRNKQEPVNPLISTQRVRSILIKPKYKKRFL